MSRISKSRESESRFVVARTRGLGRVQVIAERYRVCF